MKFAFLTHVLLVALAVATVPPCYVELALLPADPGSDVYRVYTRYGSVQPVLGSGTYAVATAGRLPPTFARHLRTPPGLGDVPRDVMDWRPGSPVAVLGLQGRYRPVERAVLQHQAEVMATLERMDPQHLFLRGRYDSELGVLVTERLDGFVPLADWLGMRGGSTVRRPPPEIERVRAQLLEALQVLRRAGLVHSDLKPDNIFLDPRTLRVRILDFSQTAREGDYPPDLRMGDTRVTRRGGNARWSSPNQIFDNPARFDDDAYTVDRIFPPTAGAMRERPLAPR